MDDLRLILLLIGAVVVGGIYAWTRYQSRPVKRSSKSKPAGVARKSHTDEPDDAAIQQELARMQQVMSGQESEEPQAVTDKELLLVVSVVAAAGQPFGGDALRKAFANNDLQLGENAIFHRLVRQDGKDVSVFGIANMVKPGHFGSGDLEGFTSPGITLFLQLPTAIDGLQAFDDFVHTAERLAVELGGQLQDQKHCVITHQALMQIRESIASSRLHTRVAS
jgi:cell division protein ZipA